MDDKELVEVWRKEFEIIIINYHAHLSLRRSPMDKYNHMGVETAWQGFLMAKRSQPVINIKKFKVSKGDDFDLMLTKNFNFVIDTVLDSITAAGVKYTIGE